MKLDYFVYNRRSLFEPFLETMAKALQGRAVRDLVLHNQGSNLVFEIVYEDCAQSGQQIYIETKNSLEDLKSRINAILDLHKSSAVLVRTVCLPDSNRHVAAVIVQIVTPPESSAAHVEPTTNNETKAKARQNKKSPA